MLYNNIYKFNINCSTNSIHTTSINKSNILDKAPSKSELSSFIFGGIKPTFITPLSSNTNIKWLHIDNEYKEEINNRTNILKNNPGLAVFVPENKNDVFLSLEKICDNLISTYPSYFEYTNNNEYIKNNITNKIYPIRAGNPLETTTGLITQDVNVLTNFDFTDPKLVASSTIYTVGWQPKDRIGYGLWQLHANVPGWAENKSTGAIKVFKDLSNNKVSFSYRTNLFVQVGRNLAIINRDNYVQSLNKNIYFDNLYLRREYQVFTPVTSNVVLFTVETHIEPLSNLNLDDLNFIYSYFKRLKPNTFGIYHDFNIWGVTLAEHIDKLEKTKVN